MTGAALDAELALLAEAVYLPTWPEVVAAIAPHWQLMVPLDVGNTEAMLCRRGDELSALVFRGTEFSRGVVSDIRSNFGGFCNWDGPGSLHAGYARYVDTIFGDGRACVLARARKEPIYLTGHSLGGAAAAIFAARIGLDPVLGDVPAGLVTFGAPACFNAAAAAAVKAPVRRHVIEGDFAPGWPLNPWVVHAGKAILHPPPSERLTRLQRHDIGLYRRVLAAGGPAQ